MGYGEKIGRNLRQLETAAWSSPAERRAVMRRYLHDGMRRLVPYIGVEDADGVIMFSATRDRTLGRALYTHGAWDPDGLPDVLRRAGIEVAGRLLVEVGANIGTTTVQAASLGARVLAFEPEPTNYRLLRANIAVNRFEAAVITREQGCSSVDGAARMSLSAVNGGEHRVSEDGDLPIELVRLDTALADEGMPASDVALLWIDAEGHEAEVLAGAPGLLDARPPVLTEFWPKGLGAKVDLFAQLLAPYPTVIDMATGNPTTVRDAAQIHRHDLTDLLFLP